MTNPVTLFTYVYPLSILMLGMMVPEFDILGASVFVSNLVGVVKVTVYWSISYLVLGYFFWGLARLGLPIFLAPMVMWCIAVLVSQSVPTLLFDAFT